MWYHSWGQVNLVEGVEPRPAVIDASCHGAQRDCTAVLQNRLLREFQSLECSRMLVRQFRGGAVEGGRLGEQRPSALEIPQAYRLIGIGRQLSCLAPVFRSMVDGYDRRRALEGARTRVVPGSCWSGNSWAALGEATHATTGRNTARASPPRPWCMFREGMGSDGKKAGRRQTETGAGQRYT